MKYWFPAIVMTVLLTVSATASANFIIECGGSEGHAYFMEGEWTPEAETGWSEDRISNGRILLIVSDGKPQLLIGDATGMFDAEKDGAKIAITQTTESMIVVVTVYPKSVETYGFQMRDDGTGEVVWT